MKKFRVSGLAVVLICLFIGYDLYVISIQGITVDSNVTEERSSINDLLQSSHTIADVIPPKTPLDLRELVHELQNATPAARRIDSDGDNLYNTVESVIGTDMNDNDTDRDQLDDRYEVLNNMDPLSPDSNDDGYPDYFEVMNVALDFDDDGVDNVWDFDNDGDGVYDGLDYSPFAMTEFEISYTLDITTSGEPTVLDFQILPENIEHLRYLGKFWDWPYDTEGTMVDMDNSTNDMRIIPYLNVTGERPDHESMTDQGLINTDNGFQVYLKPVSDNGETVAFDCMIYYPEPSLSFSLDINLVWSGIGYPDFPLVAIEGYPSPGYLPHNISLAEDGILVANRSMGDTLSSFQFVYLDEGNVAIKSESGYYWSTDAGDLIHSVTTTPDEDETFVLKWSLDEPDIFALKSVSNGFYIRVNSTGHLIADEINPTGNPNCWFKQYDSGYLTQPLPLFSFNEAYALTGFSAEECLGSNQTLFYITEDGNNDDNEDMMFAANLALSYHFLRNTSNSLVDIPQILDDLNLTVSNLSESFTDRYMALDSIREMIINVTDELPTTGTYTIISAREDTTKFIDLSEISYTANHPLVVNFNSVDSVILRNLKSSYYNTSTSSFVEPANYLSHILDGVVEEQAAHNLMLSILMWSEGETIVHDLSDPLEILMEVQLSNAIQAISIGTEIIPVLDFMKEIWKHFELYFVIKDASKALLEMGDSPKAITKWIAEVRTMGNAAKGAKNLGRFGKFLNKVGKFNVITEVILVVLEIGLAIWSGVEIANAIGGSYGREMGTAYAFSSMIVNILGPLLMLYVNLIPVVGFLISATYYIVQVLDAIYGWIGSGPSRLGKWFDSVIQGIADFFMGSNFMITQIQPHSSLGGSPEVILSDNDGLNAGDRITLLLQTIANLTAEGENQLERLQQSLFVPFVQLLGPGVDQAAIFTDWGFTTPEATDFTAGTDGTIGWLAYNYTQETWMNFPIPMNNYPVTLRMWDYYSIPYVWGHNPLGFRWTCEHTEWITNLTSYDYTTMYFDVMPANADEFEFWRAASVTDFDGDSIPDAEEEALGLSDQFKYDSDGDGLNDKFEIDNELDALSYDSDDDGLTDWYEYVYGTNVTNPDSDQDGLLDYLEIHGWTIDFYYLNNRSLPFQMQVQSDANSKDSDGDTIDDWTEYYGGTNPRSNDTNGDGVGDLPTSRTSSTVTYTGNHRAYGVLGGNQYSIRDIEAGLEDLYISIDQEYSLTQADGIDTVRLSDLTTLGATRGGGSALWPYPYDVIDLDQTMGYGGALGLDNTNDYVYCFIGRADIPLSGIQRYNLSGTEVNPDGFPQILTPDIFRDIAIADDGRIYTTNFNQTVSYLSKYEKGGILNTTFGSRGTAPDQFNLIHTLDVDSTYGYIYVCDMNYTMDVQPRVAKLDLDGNYITDLIFDAVEPFDVTVDDDGYVYVLDKASGYIRKFDPNGMEDKSFAFNGNGTHDFVEPRRITVDADKNLYILDYVGPSGSYAVFEIYKFSQTEQENAFHATVDSGADSDNDGLTNAEELLNHTITVTTENGTVVFNVTSNHLARDTDFDGLNDSLEFALGSNPRSPDSDLDDISDYDEWKYSTNLTIYDVVTLAGLHYSAVLSDASNLSLTNWDSDGDLLGDGIEFAYGSDPTDVDADGDLLSDYDELAYNTNPNHFDTDSDGASDFDEIAANTSPLHQDSDGDMVFDGVEFGIGTDALDADHDGDGVIEGEELLWGLNPHSTDSDQDGVDDAVEVALNLNARSNDSDGDNLTDGYELSVGSNPWLSDSDFDGIPDSEDPDTYAPFIGPLIIAYDADEEGNAEAFALLLEDYVTVITVSAEDLLNDYTDSKYIVLIGRPNATSETVGGLVYNLLQDTGTVLADMMAPDSHEIATRYGVWQENQTVVMFSSVLPEDVYLLLQTMKGRSVTMLPDSYRMSFSNARVVHFAEVIYNVDAISIDTLKATDSLIELDMFTFADPVLEVIRYNSSSTPHTLTNSNGLAEGERAVGRYLEVDLSEGEEFLQEATIWIFYRHSDLDYNNDGYLDEVNDFNESTLTLYYYNLVTDSWIQVSEDLEWVLAMVHNTTDVNMYGEVYAGYFAIQVTHLSLFGIAGQSYQLPVADNWMALFAILFCGVILFGVIFAFKRFRREGRFRRRYGRDDEALKSLME